MKELRRLLGKKIKELRQREKLSQQQLAELINIDTVSISNIERGLSFPSKSLIELSKALNVSLPELFNFENLKLNKDDIKSLIQKDLEILDKEKLIKIYEFIKLIK